MHHIETDLHPLEEKTFNRKNYGSKNKLHLIIIVVESIVVVGLLIGLIVVAVKKKDNDDKIQIDTDDNGNTNTNPIIPNKTNDSFDSPEGGEWNIEYKKAKQLISNYTLEEKMLLLYSTENMIGKCVGSIDANVEKNFPGICLQDGPAGVRFSRKAQSWQAAINTASTFNRTLMYEIGEAQGKEFHDKGINIMLSPCVNILRNPLGGRVWEAFGEDPFLSGEAAVQLIKGIQSQNVLACVKHFIGNEIDDPRHNSSSNIPEEALWEIYLEPFYKAVKKADVASVMESYNAVNDTFMTRNKRLLQNILKDKIGFKGFIMSDWWSINSDHYEHFANGCDMNMPGGPGWTPDKTGKNGSDWYKIKDWISAGHFTEDRVNDAATRIVASMYRFNQMPTIVTSENSYPNNVNLDYNTLNDKTRALNRQAGRESIVLLKNKDNFLPLEKNQIYKHDGKTMAIIGNNAAYSDCVAGDLDVTCGDSSNQQMRFFRGYTALGWGSGTTYFNEQVPPLDAIAGSASSLGWSVTNSTKSTGDYLNEDGTYSRHEILDDINFDPTVCNSSYVTLVFIGADSGEEYLNVENNVGDRNSLDPWHNGTQVVDRALEVCSNSKIVLIVLGPATVNINKWINNDKIQAILFGGMLGAQGGNAFVDILFGDYSPSGHLPYVWAPESSYPNVTKQNVSDGNKTDPYIYREYTYNENLYVGQRYVDKYNKPYDYPFGFGLSYSTFDFSGLSLQMKEDGLIVIFKVKNIGEYNASVVPMVFLGFPLENYPAKVFKGFDKKFLAINEEYTFKIIVEPHDLSYYDVLKESFVRPSTGSYKVYVGENARDIILNDEVNASF